MLHGIRCLEVTNHKNIKIKIWDKGVNGSLGFAYLAEGEIKGEMFFLEDYGTEKQTVEELVEFLKKEIDKRLK